jgi:hypothetical protein
MVVQVSWWPILGPQGEDSALDVEKMEEFIAFDARKKDTTQYEYIYPGGALRCLEDHRKIVSTFMV